MRHVQRNMVCIQRLSHSANMLLFLRSERAKEIIRECKGTAQDVPTIERVPEPPGRRGRDFKIIEKMNSRPEIIVISKRTYNALVVCLPHDIDVH